LIVQWNAWFQMSNEVPENALLMHDKPLPNFEPMSLPSIVIPFPAKRIQVNSNSLLIPADSRNLQIFWKNHRVFCLCSRPTALAHLVEITGADPL